MELRPYDPGRDRGALWALKRAFERELGAGDPDYEAKLTPAYRERYLEWVGRCVAEDERCVTVAAGGDLAGYAFVLPESLSMIWDAAVLNEVYVREERRGTGVADDLMAAALDLARDQDPPLDRIVLDVGPDNDRARGFYARHGFEPWGEMLVRGL